MLFCARNTPCSGILVQFPCLVDILTDTVSALVEFAKLEFGNRVMRRGGERKPSGRRRGVRLSRFAVQKHLSQIGLGRRKSGRRATLIHLFSAFWVAPGAFT